MQGLISQGSSFIKLESGAEAAVGTAEWPPRGKGPNPAQDDLQTTTGQVSG